MFDYIRRDSEYVPVYSLDWITDDTFGWIYSRYRGEPDACLPDDIVKQRSVIGRQFNLKDSINGFHMNYTIDEFIESIKTRNYSILTNTSTMWGSRVRDAFTPENILSFGHYGRHDVRTYGSVYCSRGAIIPNSLPYTPIVMMVVRRDKLEYLAKCLLIGEQPLSSIFQFWINNHVYNDTNFPGIWYSCKRYVKYIKPLVKKLEEQQIEVVYKDIPNLLDEVKLVVEKPSFKNILEYKKWLGEVAQLVDYKYTDPLEEIELRYNELRKTSNKSTGVDWGKVIVTGTGGGIRDGYDVHMLDPTTFLTRQYPMTPDSAYIWPVDPPASTPISNPCAELELPGYTSSTFQVHMDAIRPSGGTIEPGIGIMEHIRRMEETGVMPIRRSAQFTGMELITGTRGAQVFDEAMLAARIRQLDGEESDGTE